MRLRSLASRAALWAAVFAIVLRAGMPMLAVTAAQLNRVPVGEVCEVYGVVLPSMPAQHMSGHVHHNDGQAHHHSDSDAGHGCDHCALTALGALGAPNGTLYPADFLAGASVPDQNVAIGCHLHDACAAWAARLEHGPPVHA